MKVIQSFWIIILAMVGSWHSIEHLPCFGHDHARAVFEILDLPQENSNKRRQIGKSIRFHSVGFKYAEDDRFSLEKISFSIERGKRVAIVGRPKSGKTTLAKLLCGFLEAHKGMVEVPSEDIIYLGKDTQVMNCSIKDNISFGRPQVPNSDIVNAAKAVGALAWIEQDRNSADTAQELRSMYEDLKEIRAGIAKIVKELYSSEEGCEVQMDSQMINNIHDMKSLELIKDVMNRADRRFVIWLETYHSFFIAEIASKDYNLLDWKDCICRVEWKTKVIAFIRGIEMDLPLQKFLLKKINDSPQIWDEMSALEMAERKLILTQFEYHFS